MKIKIGDGMKALAGILGLTVIETVALIKGVDGTLLTFVVAAISGIAGYNLKMVKDKLKGK